MAMNPWKAPSEIVSLVNEIKNRHHSQRLGTASIAVCIEESKPFLHNKLNLGRLSKFSPLAKLWQGLQYDFCLSIPSDLWHSVLKCEQREAYLDLQLTRCGVEYIPETVEENGKKKPVKDEWGRVQYTQEIKVDDEGNPKWKIEPICIDIITQNISRYGLWYFDFQTLAEAIQNLVENSLDNQPSEQEAPTLATSNCIK